MNVLSKESTNGEIKQYFTAVLNLSNSNEEFPVNLDEVWPLVYTEKGKAVRALKSNDLFIEGVDYILLAQNGKQNKTLLAQNGKQNKDSRGGSNKETYMLSVPCLEFFIARKVRPVFEVYRQVFHKATQAAEPASVTLPEAMSLIEKLRIIIDSQQRTINANDAQLSEITATLLEGAHKEETYLDTIMDSEFDVPTFIVAADYGLTDHDLNVLLSGLGLVRWTGTQWVFRHKCIVNGYVRFQTYTYFRADDTEGRRSRFDWTKRGRVFLYNLLKSHGVLPLIEQTAPQAEENGGKEARND